MLRVFFYSWMLYWALILLLPVHAVYPAVVEATVLQLSFVALVSLGYVTMNAAGGTAGRGVTGRPRLVDARFVVNCAALMSVLGLACLLYDKVAIQGIDYSDGLAIAREQWRELGEEREGQASSVWSALGYLIGSAYYVMLVAVVMLPEQFGNIDRLRTLILTFLFALANSIITGGRSNFMLVIAFAIAAISWRRDVTWATIFPVRRQRRWAGALLLAAGLYAVYVFVARAEASGEFVAMYVVNFLPYMGLEFDAWYAQLATGEDAAAGNLAVLVLGYLTHSLSTFAAILDGPSEDKLVLFSNVAGILYKLGLAARPDDDWFLAGRFPSVPGALWHQFGPAGLFFGAVLLGAVAGVCATWARRSRRGLFVLGLYAMVGATLILTPYVFAPDFLSFPSVVTALVLLACLSWVRSALRIRKLRLRQGALGAGAIA